MSCEIVARNKMANGISCKLGDRVSPTLQLDERFLKFRKISRQIFWRFRKGFGPVVKFFDIEKRKIIYNDLVWSFLEGFPTV